MRACCLIRHQPGYRRDAFVAGLEAFGYQVNEREQGDSDLLLIWNRYGYNDDLARAYEQRGAPVLVAENGYLGREWQGRHWYALARGSHNGAGRWRSYGVGRWASMGQKLSPWRGGGSEVVILAQRGIGQRGVAQPAGWPEQALRALQAKGVRARVRYHPGENKPAIELEHDLRDASAVVTWGSGAALKALLLGIPVFHGLPNWIGAKAARPFAVPLGEPFTGARETMFGELAWAQWHIGELTSGEAFRNLLQ